MEMFVRSVDVYLKQGRQDHLMLVTPGTESDSSEFKNADGSLRQFKIKFVAGKAEVPSYLAEYLIDKEAVELEPAKVSPIIRPQAVFAEERVRTHRILGA
jgi:hypothetical protein